MGIIYTCGMPPFYLILRAEIHDSPYLLGLFDPVKMERIDLEKEVK